MFDPSKILRILESADLMLDTPHQESEWKLSAEACQLVDMFPKLSAAIKEVGDEWVQRRCNLPPVESDIEKLSQEILTLIKAYRRAEAEDQDGKEGHILYEMLADRADTLSFVLRGLGDVL